MRESAYNFWVERNGTHYVYNGVQGSLLRISAEGRDILHRWLRGEPGLVCPPGLLAALLGGGMLVGEGEDELARLESRYRKASRSSRFLGLAVVTSLGCNLDCPYCFEAKQPSLLDAEVQEAILAFLDERLPYVSGLRLTWYGGEPLLGKRALLELSDQCIACCDRTGVTYEAELYTNGLLLDRKTCEDLAARRVRRVQISLDGPQEVHDRMRPRAGGGGSFHSILRNLHAAVEFFQVRVRVDLDTENYGRVEELFQVLAQEGFAGKLRVYPGKLLDLDDAPGAPSGSYRGACFSAAAFAKAEADFQTLAARYGLTEPSLPRPAWTPCTAVRAGDLIVGSRGELYKCFHTVGNPEQVVGNIRDFRDPNSRIRQWLDYDPFADRECRSCPALPVCMGGCAHLAMDTRLREHRCTTFRHNWHAQVLAFVQSAECDEVSASPV